MPDAPESALAEIDRLIHEPARLLIMARLFVAASADFTYLQRQTGLTHGNLSSHLSRLEAAGYLEVDKRIVAKRSHTTVRLTPRGRTAFKSYRDRIREMLEDLETVA